MPVLNIAAYRFVPIADPASWVEPLRARCLDAGLKGTIIVATEGINLFLAGVEAAIEDFVAWLASEPLFAGRLVDLDVKRSWSDTQPFGRLLIKQKPEIVTMRRPSVRPGDGRAPTIAPERLAAWLAQGHDDDGRPIVLLDTRNAFEVGHGSFDGARHLGIARFDAFPDAVASLRDELADETVVTFCTGGIRCEKAALFMQDAGFSRVLQLDGGILNYFEKVGRAHWRGDCFVFDERVALDADLKGSGAKRGN
jgi:UPF0176 protein